MASLTAIRNSAGILCGRPELTTLIDIFIETTLVELHGIDVWRRDQAERYIVFPASQNEQVLPLASLPRYKALSYIRKYDPSGVNSLTNQPTGAPGKDFTEMPPDKIFDNYNLIKDNILYLANGSIYLRSWTAFQYLLVGFYQRPVISGDEITSWIADEYPQTVAIGAAQKVAGDVGETEVESRLQRQYAIQVDALRTVNIEAFAR